MKTLVALLIILAAFGQPAREARAGQARSETDASADTSATRSPYPPAKAHDAVNTGSHGQAYGTAAPQDAPNGASAPTAGIRVSDLEAARLANALFARGRMDEAAKLYTLLLESPQMEIRVEALFRLGNIYTLRQEYGKAIKMYLAILNRFPQLSRVRLELALAYFKDQDFDKADFNFRLVQGDKSIPPEVNEKIEMFLEAIRRQKKWALSANVGLVPDSNLNTASGETRECINTTYGLLCRDLEEEESGVGLRLGLNGGYYARLTRNLGLKTTAGASILDFSGSRFDDNSINIASGPRFVFKRGEVTLQPLFKKRWAGGAEYSQSYGAQLQSSFDLTRRLALDAGLDYARNRYQDDFVDDLLKGNTFNFYADLRWVLTAKSFVSAGGNYGNDDTLQKSYATEYWGCNLGYFNEFPLGITAYAALSWQRSIYKAPSWFITDDGYIEEKRRKDNTFQGLIRLSNRHWEYMGFSPAISYVYTNRRSNVWNRDYSKQRLEFSIRQIF